MRPHCRRRRAPATGGGDLDPGEVVKSYRTGDIPYITGVYMVFNMGYMGIYVGYIGIYMVFIWYLYGIKIYMGYMGYIWGITWYNRVNNNIFIWLLTTHQKLREYWGSSIYNFGIQCVFNQ